MSTTTTLDLSLNVTDRHAHAIVQARSPTHSLFGDLVLLLFLFVQGVDGVFTYVGVVTFGPGVEANPLIAALMAEFGHGPALVGAKVVAALLGILLHLRGVHGAIAGLTVFYLTVAVIPWVALLFL